MPGDAAQQYEFPCAPASGVSGVPVASSHLSLPSVATTRSGPSLLRPCGPAARRFSFPIISNMRNGSLSSLGLVSSTPTPSTSPPLIPACAILRDSIPHHGNEHTSQAQKVAVARQGRHEGAGKRKRKRNHIIIIDEVEYHVGAFPYPFRGHEVACRLLQPLWGRQRPTAQSYSHSPSM
eukprot:scaffold21332_cov148-Isochrysis_galbana.AAC.2